MPRRGLFGLHLVDAHAEPRSRTLLGVHHFRLNNVAVVLSNTPIEALVRAGGFDALVSSDDTRLSMKDGVSRAIFTLGVRL